MNKKKEENYMLPKYSLKLDKSVKGPKMGSIIYEPAEDYAKLVLKHRRNHVFLILLILLSGITYLVVEAYLLGISIIIFVIYMAFDKSYASHLREPECTKLAYDCADCSFFDETEAWCSYFGPEEAEGDE